MKKPTKGMLKFWRNVLAESGFDDIEYQNGNLRTCGGRATVDAKTKQTGGGHHRRKAEYFTLLSSAMNASDFVKRWPPLSRRVIAMHVEGATYRAICRSLHVGAEFTATVIREFRGGCGIKLDTSPLAKKIKKLKEAELVEVKTKVKVSND